MSGFLKFHDLMRFMVREILLVSSPYDAFILEEDGRIDERLFSAYTELSLSSIPRLTHVSTAVRAMELLAERRFDIVITVLHVGDTDGLALSRLVKERYPTMPIVLLAFDEADLGTLPSSSAPDTIDRIFLWDGDAQILLAAIKIIEDARNLAHDTRTAGVPVIIVVEDTPRRYSRFLALLYSELMTQSRSLIAEGLNALHRAMRMRARPKILLCTTYEEALGSYVEHQDHVMAVISDVRFPRDGIEDPEAGFALARLIRSGSSDLPLLLQSAELEAKTVAGDLDAWFADKNSPALNDRIRAFLREALGFGDFIFRLPDRTEVGHARDLYELAQVLRAVPPESVEYHASRNHFSSWLSARAMFSLAGQVRPRTIAEFKGIDALRQYIIEVLEKELAQEQEGLIADFSARHAGPQNPFVRLGKGSVGGKGRSIAFVGSLMARHAFTDRAELQVLVPRTAVIGTDEFDRFLEANRIWRDDLPKDDLAIRERFLEGQLGDRLMHDLGITLDEMHGPIAVRSSSLLEDSRSRPFAGIYATVMLPNNDPDAAVRFEELCRAVKAVYASAFSRGAQSYFGGTPQSVQDEKMAVVVQELVGHRYGDRFYPHVSGLAQSWNYYPVGPQRAEDGIAFLALGLGHAVVSGGTSLRFSPGCPGVLPQFASARDFVRGSQAKFYALDLSKPIVDYSAGTESSLVLCDLATAEADGSLAFVGSVYSAADDLIRDNLGLAGPRVVTFNNLLKWNEVPLASALAELLRVFRHGMGTDVEVEFALDLACSGRGSGPRPSACLYVLQLRPMATPLDEDDVEAEGVPAERILCRTGRALGHGRITDIRDVVYVKKLLLDSTTTPSVAAQVGQINATLVAARAPYLLVGPGRWGSADPGLGIPVEWSQIAGARVMVETTFNGRPVEPSQGTHFFQNITSLRIGYLSVDETRPNGEVLDVEWLERQPAVRETAAVRHVRLPEPLTVYLDGRARRATVVKP
ncbi:MAG: hypothetical protein HYY06_22645 [Deltaproteobacteria bacterium]|nr:hypothetical protein [Deltaproteobacteria bacterium]